MKKWLFEEELEKNLRTPNEGNLTEEDILTFYLLGNVPLLICDSHPWVNQVDKLKNFAIITKRYLFDVLLLLILAELVYMMIE
jgi:hypothetical protein